MGSGPSYVIKGAKSRIHRFLLLPVMIVGTILFFVDMNEGATSAVRQLYGFASENFQKTIDQPFYFAVNAL